MKRSWWLLVALVVIDYSPEFYAVAYMDGHAKLFEKAQQ